MKRGDILQKETLFKAGDQLWQDTESEESIKTLMLCYPEAQYKVIQLEDTKKYAAELLQDFIDKEEWEVNWVVGEEVAIHLVGDVYNHELITIQDPRFKVIKESVADFQSQVANLSDEELKASIDELRAGRTPMPLTKTLAIKKKKVQKEAKSEEDIQLEKMLATMTPNEQLELKRKLGL